MNSVCYENFNNYKDLINDNSEKNPSQSLLDSGNKKSNSKKDYSFNDFSIAS